MREPKYHADVFV